MLHFHSKQSIVKRLLLPCILLLAFAVRIYGIDWDQGQHLHPDERFLTMVTVTSKIPATFGQYLDPKTSSLNPTNIGFNFFVYGTLPLTVAKLFAVFFGFDSYERFTILGRFLSAVFDVGTIVFIYLIVLLFERQYKINNNLKYIASFLYAIFVLPIQLSHFFAVDTFLTFFLTGALFFSLQFFYTRSYKSCIMAGLFVGGAMASKISTLYSLPLFIFLFVFPIFGSNKKTFSKMVFKITFALALFALASYLILRCGSPYMFGTGSILNPHLNTQFVANIKQLTSFNNPAEYFPPNIQWISKKPILFSLENIIFFGVGLPAAILIAWGTWLFYKKKNREIIIVGLWALLFFLYQSTQYVKSIRYFYVLYPLFAVVAALGFLDVWKKISNPIYKCLLLFAIILWPLMFMRIYTRSHSRVEASQWMYDNIPPGSVLAQEHWDDALPLPFPNRPINSYEVIQMPVFDPDTSDKWAVINPELAKADYIVFTSNRGYGSIMTVPEKYPRMSQFYKDLFSEKTQFQKIKVFTSYPELSFLGLHLSFPDQWSEETFTVYDHPKITIFKKIK